MEPDLEIRQQHKLNLFFRIQVFLLYLHIFNQMVNKGKKIPIYPPNVFLIIGLLIIDYSEQL